MRNRVRLRHAVTLLSAVGLTLTSAGAAGAAPAPGWRIVKTFARAEGVWSELFTSSGHGNSWSVWKTLQDNGGNPRYRTDVEHSAGGAWRRVPVPPSLRPQVKWAVAAAASSAHDDWLFCALNGTGTLLRWDGAAWHTQALPSWVLRPDLAGVFSVTSFVFSRASAWVFSLGADAVTNPHHYAARYRRGRWSKVTLPGIPEKASARSPLDIWALGASLKGNHGNQLLMHWNGKRWHTVPLPKAQVPAGATEIARDLAVTGRSDVWLQRDIQQGSAGERTLYLLRWNGRSWRRVRLADGVSSVGYLAPDGHGGLWAAANGPAPADRRRIYSVSPGGWTRYAVPTVKGTSLGEVFSLTWIPGTRSIWAASNMVIPTGGVVGAILKYGR